MSRTITFEAVSLDFAAALRRLRKKQNMSQGDVFRKSGLERSYISRLENGDILDPRLTTAIILARALGMSVDDLVREAVSKDEEESGGKRTKKA